MRTVDPPSLCPRCLGCGQRVQRGRLVVCDHVLPDNHPLFHPDSLYSQGTS